MRLWFFAVLFGLAIGHAFAATDDEIARAIRDLGASDFKTRETATQLLWAAGDGAVPALEEAVAASDPEVALRARQVLANIRLGILPNTPPAIRTLVEQYRAGDLEQRRATVDALLEKGDEAWPTLLLLAASEPSLESRAIIFQVPLEQLAERLRAFAVAASPDANQLKEALRDTETWIKLVPEDITVPLLIIPKLDALGKRPAADALFQAELAFQKKAAADQVRDSKAKGAEASNNLAWFCAVARRELPTGLAAAQQAVTLAPRQAPYLDTLAEIHFQQGNKAKALELIKQAIELDPHLPYFKEQLDRIEKGDPAVPPPDTTLEELTE